MHYKEDKDVFAEYAFTIKEGIHAVLRNALGQAISHSRSVNPEKPKRLKSFLGFVSATLALLQKHHDIEESIEFPAFRNTKRRASPFRPTVFDELCNTHDDLYEETRHLSDYIVEVEENPLSYDGAILQSLLISIQDLMLPHFTEEESLLTADNLRSNFSTELVEAVYHRMIDATFDDHPIFLPLMATNMSDEARKRILYEEGGWFFAKIGLPWLCYQKRSWWKFSMFTL